jgi:hypothetical protein
MLEVAIVLEMVLGKYIEAAVITVLLAFNAEGSVLLLDQSMLTGESVPIEAGAAVAEVTVTATSPNNRQGIGPPKEAIHGAIAIIRMRCHDEILHRFGTPLVATRQTARRIRSLLNSEMASTIAFKYSLQPRVSYQR